MEFLNDIRSWIDTNINWLTLLLLILLLFKTCTCHSEILTLLGGNNCKSKKDYLGGGYGHKHSKKNIGGDKNKKPLVIKLFWVDWCGHCNRFKPIWNKLKKENTEDVDYVDINCEKEKELAHKEKIEGFPTIRLYDADGNLLEELEGSRDEDNIKNLIKNHI